MNNNNWIDVCDKMPEINQEVIIFSNGVVQVQTFYIEFDGDGGLMWANDSIGAIAKVMPDKDKWQPLPEPPTKGE